MSLAKLQIFLVKAGAKRSSQRNILWTICWKIKNTKNTQRGSTPKFRKPKTEPRGEEHLDFGTQQTIQFCRSSANLWHSL
jgi:hypothetical protein